MKKIGIVAKREYLYRINKKSFIILTLLMPIMMAALVFVPLWLSSIESTDTHDVAIVDRTGKYAPLLNDTEKFRFISLNDNETLAKSRESRQGTFAFIEITDDLLRNPDAITIYSEKQIPADLRREVSRTLSLHLESEKRSSFNIPNLDDIIRDSRVNLDIQTIKWGKDGAATESSSELTGLIGVIFTIIIYMFIMMYGGMVMQGVVEEKTNRIVEVMISSVRPFDLMMGKIIGVGLVGLTQVLIWGVLTTVLMSVGGIILGATGGMDISAMSPAGVQPEMANMPQAMNILSKLHSFNFAEIILYFVLFFIGGYISYASIFAAVGSAVNTPEDSQQFMTPMIIFLMFAVYAGMYSAQNPDGPLAFWCSLIPFTSPIVMMVRIPYEIPFWQILLSLTLLFSSAVFFVWLSAKIYRVGILMYGKKPSLKEIARWVRY